MDLDDRSRTEDDLIRRYRDIIVIQPECDRNNRRYHKRSPLSNERDDLPVSLVLDNLKVSESIKRKIREEFDNILKLLDFEGKPRYIS